VSVTLLCPRCRGQIEETTDQIVCARCGQDYFVDDRAIDLIGESEFFWSEIPADEMRELIDLADKQGVSAAVLWLADRYPDLAQYVVSRTRIDWLFHCYSPNAAEACLDLGSGWGTLSLLLSGFYREVWSLESVQERIDFQKVRLREDQVDNVHLLRANMLDLPFEDASFDLVVLNGTLEWTAAMQPAGNPRDVQLEFLRGIRRILRPGGAVYVGIENRYGWNYFVGDRDHSGLRFTSLLPRWGASWAVRLFSSPRDARLNGKREWDDVNWSEYRTWTYSSAGYRTLLSDAGFDDVEVCWSWPSYSFPRYSGLLSDKKSFRLFLSTYFAQRVQVRGDLKSKLFRWLINAPILGDLLRRTNPSFLIYAHKGAAGSTLRDRLLRSQGAAQEPYFHKGGGIESGNAFVLSGADGRGSAVLKYPRFPHQASSLERQEQRFAEMNDLDLERSEVGNLPVFREPFLRGSAFQVYDPDHNRLAVEWLLGLHASTRGEPTSVDRLAEQAESVRRSAVEVLDASLHGDVASCCSESVQISSGLPSVLEHGDFTAANIWVGGGGRLLVFDWEFSEPQGSSLFDLCFLLVSNAYRGTDPERALGSTLSGDGPYAKIWRDVLGEFCSASSLQRDLVEAYLPYSILRLLVRYRSQVGYNFHLFRRLFSLVTRRNRPRA
jgi:SAM-dependent methyltransferase